jgi:hypothetical protein
MLWQIMLLMPPGNKSHKSVLKHFLLLAKLKVAAVFRGLGQVTAAPRSTHDIQVVNERGAKERKESRLHGFC